MLLLTPYKKFVATWSKGCGNEICKRASRIVLARGDVPAEVLFIGEAPGTSENTIGVPFIGKAGKLLDRLIAASVKALRRCPTMAFCNLVGCIPTDKGDDEEKNQVKRDVEPTREEIKQCQQRLIDFVRVVRPRVIVNVGKLSKQHVYGQAMFSLSEDGMIDWLPRTQSFIEFVDVVHPAAILRMNDADQGLATQKVIVRLENAFYDIFEQEPG